MSEQSLFNELDIQKQIIQNQAPKQQHTKPEKPVKLELVPQEIDFDPVVSDLLKQEDTLINLMLNFGDVVLKRQNENNEKYEITVIEEILQHFEEENYEFQLETNRIIYENIKEGIQKEGLKNVIIYI